MEQAARQRSPSISFVSRGLAGEGPETPAERSALARFPAARRRAAVSIAGPVNRLPLLGPKKRSYRSRCRAPSFFTNCSIAWSARVSGAVFPACHRDNVGSENLGRGGGFLVGH